MPAYLAKSFWYSESIQPGVWVSEDVVVCLTHKKAPHSAIVLGKNVVPDTEYPWLVFAVDSQGAVIGNTGFAEQWAAIQEYQRRNKWADALPIRTTYRNPDDNVTYKRGDIVGIRTRDPEARLIGVLKRYEGNKWWSIQVIASTVEAYPVGGFDLHIHNDDLIGRYNLPVHCFL